MGIADILIKLTKELHSLIKTARAAPDVKRFARETSTFIDLLDYFSEVVKGLPESKDEEAKKRKKKLFKNVKNDCKILKRGIEELLGKFIQMNDGGLSPLRTLWARLLWSYKRNDVEFLRHCLESSKSTVSLLATLFCLEKENAGGGERKKLFELQEANQELEDFERHHYITLQVAQGLRYTSIIRSAYGVEKYAARQITSQKEATASGPGAVRVREKQIYT
ncbi:hypothetical protein DL769_005418 [Monosporascus sp. CRB-8-3]|nr:hypothetical protein DL769_005418 [Monosporascus sp. CRB-8-3]